MSRMEALTVNDYIWPSRVPASMGGLEVVSAQQSVDSGPLAISANTLDPVRVRRRRKVLTRSRLIGTCSVIVTVGLWQALVDTHLVASFLLAPPDSVVIAIYHLLVKGNLLKDLEVSAYQFVIGYAMSVVFGVVLGLLMGWFSAVRAALQPIVSALYSTPNVALIPLFVVWFGVGNRSKIAIIFIGALFPVLFNTLAGVGTADKELLEMAGAFGASQRQVFRSILLPAAVPFIMTGLRLALGIAIILMVVGEMLAGTSGIGYMIENAGEQFAVPQIFAGVVIVAVASTIMMALLRRLERRFDAWRPAR